MFAKFSVKKPLTVFVAVMMVIILGIVSFTKMTPDLLPSINLPYAIVVTSYPGATPEEVETQVSKPMEQSMASLENIKDISSVSRENMSQLMLQFNDSVNMDSVVSDIREKINAVSGAWDDKVGTPFIMKLNPDLLPVVVSAVGYGDKNNIELTEFLNQDLMSKLEGITGVASVNVNGNVTEKIDVTLSEEKLKAINDKIKKSLDGKFENAEEELNEKRTDLQEGKNELENKTGDLESAKSELESGKAALLDQSAQAQGQLLNKKTELENAKMEIKQQMEQAKSNLTLLKESEKAISQLNTSLQEVNSQIAVLDETIASLQQIQTTYDGLQQQKTALEQEIAGIEAGTIIPEGDPAEALAALRAELGGVTAQIAALEATLAEMGTTPAELSGKIVELQGKKTALSTALSEINSAMAMLGVTPETIETTLGEIQTNIGAIESGLAQMEGALVELDSGAVSMNDALAELNRQQLQGSMEISGGLSQIMAGQSSLSAAKSQMSAAEKQLDGAQGDFEQKKDSAYKSANVEITMDMVNQILMAQNFSMPVGYITGGEVDYLVRVGDKIQDVEALQNLLLFDTGVEGVEKIYLKDVATVALTDNATELYAKINGSDGVILSFSKQSTYATATVSENINKKFSELSKEYEGLTFSNLSDQGDYINIVVKTVLDNLVLGAILAVLILLIFLKDIKPTAVIACSIPISVLFAVVLMYFSGITLNVISLSGLAIGVGMLVDNSVVVIENIYRMRKEGQSVLQAAVTGATQVTGAIVASTLTTICVFLPIAFVEGITRQLFVDMALTIAYSLLASLVVALTLVPAMASGMLKKDNEKSHKIFDRFLQGYDKLARVSLKHKWVVIAFSVILLVGSTFLVLQKGFIFMPTMSGTQISVTVTAPKDATFSEKKSLADEIYQRVDAIEDIETIGTMVSGGGTAMMGGGGDISLYAILKSNAKEKDTEISKEIVSKCADLDCTVSAQGAMDMGSYMTAMSGAGVVVNIYGNDLDHLITEAEKVGAELKGIAGIGEVSTGIEDATPEIRVVVDKEKAMLQGLTTAQVYQSVAAKVKSETPSTSINMEGFDKNIVIHSEKNQNMTPKNIREMQLTVKDKEGKEKEIRLSSLAEIRETKSLNAVNRSNQRRYISVEAGIADGFNVTKVADTVRSAMKNYTPISGNTVEIGGESDTIMEAVKQLIYMGLLAIVIIYFIMVAQFQSFKSPFIVMFTIPLAFTGGFIALLLTGKDLSVVSIVGFIMLAGIIVNNGIVLIDYINILRLEGMEKKEAILLAGRVRMRPILMTALTTILGLVFMAVATGFGAELMQPMAIVCIGGLSYATLMTLFVVPALYDIFSRKEMKKREIQ